MEHAELSSSVIFVCHVNFSRHLEAESAAFSVLLFCSNDIGESRGEKNSKKDQKREKDQRRKLCLRGNYIQQVTTQTDRSPLYDVISAPAKFALPK